MAQVQSNDPDPNGDVILLIGKDQTPMKVCSQVVSLASPTLAALLKPCFREGHELSVRGTVTIPLSDDDPDAFRIICNVLHFKNEHLQVDLPTLLKISIACDYYELGRPLLPWAGQWLGPHLKQTPISDWQANAQSLCISYILGDGHAFTQSTQSLLLYASDANMDKLSESECFMLLPSGLLSKSKSNRSLQMSHR